MIVGCEVVLDPVINGTLTYQMSWRWIMVVNAVVSVVVLLMTPRFLPGGRPSTSVRPSFDRLLRSHNFISATAVSTLTYVAFGMIFFTLAFDHHTGCSLTARDIGLSFAAYGAFRVVLSPAAGVLADRVGVRTPLLIGLELMFVSMVAFAISHSLNHVVATTVALAVSGAGVALFAPAANSAAFGHVHVEDRSDASALFWTLRLIGSAVGVAIAVSMLVMISGTTKPEFGVNAGYGDAAVWIWVVGAVISLIAVVITLVGIRTSTSTEDSVAIS